MIREAILNVYGTRFYKQITYTMRPWATAAVSWIYRWRRTP